MTDWPDFDDVIDPDAVEVPGSRPRVKHEKRDPEPRVVKPWDAYPKTYRVDGQDMELFGAAALAQALGIKAATLKKWERMGWLPKTALRLARKVRAGRDVSPLGHEISGRRLYTRSFIEGVIRLAEEEGLFGTTPLFPSQTKFPERALDLYYDTMPGEPAQ